MPNNKRTFYRKIFPTAHKILLDRKLKSYFHGLNGDVLVIGAGYENYRTIITNAGKILHTDLEFSGHVEEIADAHSLPFEKSSYQSIVAIEVFEHLKQPDLAAAEIHRVLKNGGVAIISIPFMFRIHGDPFDFQRLTESGLRELFNQFSEVSISPFGGRLQVISDLITTYARPLAALRFLNYFFTLKPIVHNASRDCPSGYIVKLKK